MLVCVVLLLGLLTLHLATLRTSDRRPVLARLARHDHVATGACRSDDRRDSIREVPLANDVIDEITVVALGAILPGS